MVAQENRPLAVGRNFRGLAQNIGDREAILLSQRHVHARHQREVKRHVAFITVKARRIGITEVQLSVFGPLVGLGE
ncbi:hypothetical protein D3C72_1334500 [compost metagenome]